MQHSYVTLVYWSGHALRTPLRPQRSGVGPEVKWIPFGADGFAGIRLLIHVIHRTDMHDSRHEPMLDWNLELDPSTNWFYCNA
jgi:hypothetical protein